MAERKRDDKISKRELESLDYGDKESDEFTVPEHLVGILFLLF